LTSCEETHTIEEIIFLDEKINTRIKKEAKNNGANEILAK